MDIEKIQRVLAACIELTDAMSDVYYNSSNFDVCHARIAWRRHYTEVDEMSEGNEIGDFARKVDEALLIMCGVEMKVGD